MNGKRGEREEREPSNDASQEASGQCKVEAQSCRLLVVFGELQSYIRFGSDLLSIPEHLPGELTAYRTSESGGITGSEGSESGGITSFEGSAQE